MPGWDILVGQTGSNIKHDDSTLPVDAEICDNINVSKMNHDKTMIRNIMAFKLIRKLVRR